MVITARMKKVSKNDYRNYISWAKENTANMVYPCSIAEGFQPGDIYVNDSANVESVFFWHYCGFGYISGKASEKMLGEIYSEMISGHNGRRLVLITADARAALRPTTARGPPARCRRRRCIH